MKGTNLEFLAEIPLFADLSPDELAHLTTLFEEKRYKRGAILFLEEDTGNYMYVVKSGRVKVSRVLTSGKEMILTFHDAGDYFGELSLIDGGTAPATVTAVVATAILVINQHRFAWMIQNPKIKEALLRNLCGRLREAWAQVEVLGFHNASARVGTMLYNLCQSKGITTSDGTMISLRLTHKQIADLIGISRGTVTRVLNQLQADGLIRVRARRFVVGDPEELLECGALVGHSVPSGTRAATL